MVWFFPINVNGRSTPLAFGQKARNGKIIHKTYTFSKLNYPRNFWSTVQWGLEHHNKNTTMFASLFYYSKTTVMPKCNWWYGQVQQKTCISCSLLNENKEADLSILQCWMYIYHWTSSCQILPCYCNEGPHHRLTVEGLDTRLGQSLSFVAFLTSIHLKILPDLSFRTDFRLLQWSFFGPNFVKGWKMGKTSMPLEVRNSAVLRW